MRHFTIFVLIVMLNACGILHPTDGYRAQYYSLDEMRNLFVAGKYEEVVIEADTGLNIQVFEKTGPRVSQGKLNRYEMRLLRAESNLILGNIAGLHAELDQMRVGTPSEEARTTILKSRVYSKQNNSELAVAELINLVRPSTGEFSRQGVVGSYILIPDIDDEWKGEYVEIAQLITEQLAVILSENHGSTDAISASIEMLELGYKSEVTHSVIVDQMGNGYNALSLLLAKEYMEKYRDIALGE